MNNNLSVRKFFKIIFLMFSVYLSDVSYADLVTYKFEGTVDRVSPEIGSKISPGEKLTGSYTFYTDTPGLGIYAEPFESIKIQIGSKKWNLGAPTDLLPNAISIINNTGGPDIYDVQIIPEGPSINKYDPKRFGIVVFDSTGSLFKNFSLTKDVPNIRKIPQENRGWVFDFENRKSISGSLTSLTFGSSKSGQKPTAYLLLHGLNSDPATWNTLVRKVFKNNCTTVEYNDIYREDNDIIYNKGPIEKNICYRYHFKKRTTNGTEWENGDGATYQELGLEVGGAINSIVSTQNPGAIVIVGHSRGGLAARAFLQDSPLSYRGKIGLLTIGTPHQGSPFGRIKHWMDTNRYSPSDIGQDDFRFIFSPSVGYLATDHNTDGKPIQSSISKAIWDLNENAIHLGKYVSVFGQIVSVGLMLGENAVFGIDLLEGTRAARILPGDFEDMKAFILQNIANIEKNGDFCSEQDKSNSYSWACNGDGIVPFISQRLSALPNFDKSKSMVSGVLYRVAHTKETGEWKTIRDVLEKMTQENGFKPLD